MQQHRRLFKLISTLSVINVLFTLILMITLVAINQHGFGIPESQSTPSNDYFSQKYQAEIQFRKRLRFFFIIFALICLTCLVLAVFWGFSTQNIQDIPENSSYSKAYNILTSCVIIFLIPTAGYYTSRTSQTQPKSVVQLVTGIIIMVQSWIVLILALIIWAIFFKKMPLQSQELQNFELLDDQQKKNQPLPQRQNIYPQIIVKEPVQAEISSRPLPHLEETKKNEKVQSDKQMYRSKPQITIFDPYPNKRYTSRSIPLCSQYSDFTSRPQMLKFFERRNHEQQLRKLNLKEQIEKKKLQFKSPSCIIPQQLHEEQNVLDGKWAKTPTMSRCVSQYIQQEAKPTPRLQISQQQEECLQYQAYKRQPGKITNLFDRPKPASSSQQQQGLKFQTTLLTRQRAKKKLFNIVQWNMKKKMISSRLDESSIYESQIHNKTSTRQSKLTQILKRRYNSSSQLE